jgi:hypothetical protein
MNTNTFVDRIKRDYAETVATWSFFDWLGAEAYALELTCIEGPVTGAARAMGIGCWAAHLELRGRP